jgi:hypothetical protein
MLRALLVLRLGDVGEVVGLETMLDEFTILFLVAHDDGAGVGLNDLAYDAEVLDLHVVAVT